MTKQKAARVLGICLILSIALGMTGCLNRMDVTGTWVGYVTWEPGDSFEGQTTTIQLELLQDRRAVTGTTYMDASFMELSLDIVTGEGSNNYITLEMAGAAQGSGTTHAIFLMVEGIVTSSTIDGTGRMTIDGASHAFTWLAQRSS